MTFNASITEALKRLLDALNQGAAVLLGQKSPNPHPVPVRTRRPSKHGR